MSDSCHTLPFKELHFHDNEITSVVLQGCREGWEKNKTKEQRKSLHNYITQNFWLCKLPSAFVAEIADFFLCWHPYLALPKRLKWCHSLGKTRMTILFCKHGCPNHPCLGEEFPPQWLSSKRRLQNSFYTCRPSSCCAAGYCIFLNHHQEKIRTLDGKRQMKILPKSGL